MYIYDSQDSFFISSLTIPCFCFVFLSLYSFLLSFFMIIFASNNYQSNLNIR
ncbi:hypothetical protein HMPREF3034_00228 [Prevotella sp. DNF00663]|nr:hypothetical protein HMPREF3034_00228 [Prevotella sp. DNF00663]